jgi:hypothetical protein
MPADSPTQTPTPTWTPDPTATLPPTETPTEEPTPTVEAPARALYVCGYELCRDSSEYGELIFENDIEVWEALDPDDDRIHHLVAHHDEVWVVSEERLWDGPGGLWFALQGGGWISDFWLTGQRCTPENLEEYSFADCMLGEY